MVAAQAAAKKKLLEAKKKVTKAFTEKPPPPAGQLTADQKIALAFSKFNVAKLKAKANKGDAGLKKKRDYLYSMYMLRKNQKDAIAKKRMTADPEFAKALQVAKEKAAKAAKKAEQLSEDDINKILSDLEEARQCKDAEKCIRALVVKVSK